MQAYPEGTQIVSATARVYGHQTTRVRAECNGGVGDEAYVCVQVGSTVVYAYDLAAVQSFRKAWQQAIARPMGLLIDKPKSLPWQRDYLTAVSVTVRHKQAYRVLAIGADASVDKQSAIALSRLEIYAASSSKPLRGHGPTAPEHPADDLPRLRTRRRVPAPPRLRPGGPQLPG